jgi:hypothetical protein
MGFQSCLLGGISVWELVCVYVVFSLGKKLKDIRLTLVDHLQTEYYSFHNTSYSMY